MESNNPLNTPTTQAPLPTQPTDPTPIPTHQPPVASRHWPVFIGIILIFGMGCFLVYQYVIQKQQATITTFEACTKDSGGQIQESYPPTCVTRDGRRFIQSLTNEEKKNLTPPSPTTDPGLLPEKVPTANWKTYTSKKIGYSIQAPQTWFAQQTEDNSLLTHQDYLSNLLLSPESLDGMNLNNLSINYPISIKGPHKDMGVAFEKGLEGLAVSDTTNIDQLLQQYVKRTTSYTTISGKRALVVKRVWDQNPPPKFAGEWCGGCMKRDYYIDLENGTILSISDYRTKEQSPLETTYDQILSTFKFIDQTVPTITSTAYSCPKNGYVDCMPSPNAGVKYECTPEAFTWFKANCPDFKGGAL